MGFAQGLPLCGKRVYCDGLKVDAILNGYKCITEKL
jgi:hypothetical protein